MFKKITQAVGRVVWVGGEFGNLPLVSPQSTPSVQCDPCVPSRRSYMGGGRRGRGQCFTEKTKKNCAWDKLCKRYRVLSPRSGPAAAGVRSCARVVWYTTNQAVMMGSCSQSRSRPKFKQYLYFSSYVQPCVGPQTRSVYCGSIGSRRRCLPFADQSVEVTKT